MEGATPQCNVCNKFASSYIKFSPLPNKTSLLCAYCALTDPPKERYMQVRLKQADLEYSVDTEQYLNEISRIIRDSHETEKKIEEYFENLKQQIVQSIDNSKVGLIQGVQLYGNKLSELKSYLAQKSKEIRFDLEATFEALSDLKLNNIESYAYNYCNLWEELYKAVDPEGKAQKELNVFNQKYVEKVSKIRENLDKQIEQIFRNFDEIRIQPTFWNEYQIRQIGPLVKKNSRSFNESEVKTPKKSINIKIESSLKKKKDLEQEISEKKALKSQKEEIPKIDKLQKEETPKIDGRKKKANKSEDKNNEISSPKHSKSSHVNNNTELSKPKTSDNREQIKPENIRIEVAKSDLPAPRKPGRPPKQKDFQQSDLVLNITPSSEPVKKIKPDSSTSSSQITSHYIKKVIEYQLDSKSIDIDQGCVTYMQGMNLAVGRADGVLHYLEKVEKKNVEINIGEGIEFLKYVEEWKVLFVKTASGLIGIDDTKDDKTKNVVKRDEFSSETTDLCYLKSKNLLAASGSGLAFYYYKNNKSVVRDETYKIDNEKKIKKLVLVQFEDNGEMLGCIYEDGLITFYSVAPNTFLQKDSSRNFKFSGSPLGVFFYPKSKKLFLATDRALIMVWDYESGPAPTKIIKIGALVKNLFVVSDKYLIYNKDSSISVWNIEDEQIVEEHWKELPNLGKALAYNPEDNEFLASYQNGVSLWKIKV